MAKASLAKVKEQEATQPKAEKAPHEINSALSSPRMQALLKEHQAMGVRPK